MTKRQSGQFGGREVARACSAERGSSRLAHPQEAQAASAKSIKTLHTLLAMSQPWKLNYVEFNFHWCFEAAHHFSISQELQSCSLTGISSASHPSHGVKRKSPGVKRRCQTLWLELFKAFGYIMLCYVCFVDFWELKRGVEEEWKLQQHQLWRPKKHWNLWSLSWKMSPMVVVHRPIKSAALASRSEDTCRHGRHCRRSLRTMPVLKVMTT